jgi:phosphoribosylformylglycinamidine (FGAM) synthase PurS component
MSEKIDNRKFKGIYSELVKMLDPKGEKGLTSRAVRDQYYRGVIEVREAHRIIVRRRKEAAKKDAARLDKITKSVREMIDDQDGIKS